MPPRVRTGYVVGAKAVARSAGRDLARVHVANDAPEAVTSPIRRLAAEWGLPVDDTSSCAALGGRCGLGRPVAALGELKFPGIPADS